MLGYNQLVKRDSHDWDVDSPPTLVTTRAGHAIVASANKDGQLAVLDRPQIVRGRTVTGDIGAALPVLYRMPTTTRTNIDVSLSADSVVRFCPGITGGSEWNGAAYSPSSNALYVGAVDWCASVQLKRDTLTIPPAGTTWLGNQNTSPFGPATEAGGWLTAFDAENGAVRWKFHAPHPMLAGVTPTGGGIITYVAGGRQLVAVASGMKSPTWPGAAKQSRILVYGLH